MSASPGTPELTTSATPIAPCHCGVAIRQPWRDPDAMLTKAPVAVGLIVWAIAVVVTVAAIHQRWIGYLLLGLLAAALVAAFAVQRAKGHRGWCWVRRSAWLGVAGVGLPAQLLTLLNF
ncbi:MAG: hypothetical protein ACR2KJ_05300 [Jatrophihabitans sp.]